MGDLNAGNLIPSDFILIGLISDDPILSDFIIGTRIDTYFHFDAACTIHL